VKVFAALYGSKEPSVVCVSPLKVIKAEEELERPNMGKPCITKVAFLDNRIFEFIDLQFGLYCFADLVKSCCRIFTHRRWRSKPQVTPPSSAAPQDLFFAILPTARMLRTVTRHISKRENPLLYKAYRAHANC
jgi:hypothetical protein